MSVYIIEASKRLQRALQVAYGLAVLATLHADIHWSAKTMACLILLLGAWRTNRQGSSVRVRCDPINGLEIWHGRSQMWQEATPLSGCVILPGIAVLRLQTGEGGAAETILVLPGCLSEEEFRRLRVCARRVMRG